MRIDEKQRNGAIAADCALAGNCGYVLPSVLKGVDTMGLSMRGRRRRNRFLEFRNHQLSMIRHWQYHSRFAMLLNAEIAQSFAEIAGITARNLARKANSLPEKDWEILLK